APGSSTAAAAGNLDELPVHLARPGGGEAHGRRRDGDEGRRGGGERNRSRDLFGPQAPLYSDASRLRPPMRLLFLLLVCVSDAWAAHAYSQFGDIKYPAGFKHFEWVNPDAPKGGDIDLVPPLRITNFDKYNPFTLKGTSPPGLTALVFE